MSETTSSDAKKPVSGTILNAARKYLARMEAGERILRDASGKLQWASGKAVGTRTVEYLLKSELIDQLDTDLFGDASRGQTLGICPCNPTNPQNCKPTKVLP